MGHFWNDVHLYEKCTVAAYKQLEDHLNALAPRMPAGASAEAARAAWAATTQAEPAPCAVPNALSHIVSRVLDSSPKSRILT